MILLRDIVNKDVALDNFSAILDPVAMVLPFALKNLGGAETAIVRAIIAAVERQMMEN